MKIGIAGAGLLGRLICFRLAAQNHQIDLFDQDDVSGGKSCGTTAAGMLSPYAEITTASAEIVKLGLESIELWEGYLKSLSRPELLSKKGSILCSHALDQTELKRFISHGRFKLKELFPVYEMDKKVLADLEPELEIDGSAYFSPKECFINNVELFATLTKWLSNHSAITWKTNRFVSEIGSHYIESDGEKFHYDLVIDCRGMGAASTFSELRGVRGEVICLHAPEVNLRHSIRLMHPRYPLYIVPRQEHHYIIGASEIESEDYSPISVRSALELLSALSIVHRGFLEARITQMLTNCRPTLPDNMPAIKHSKGFIAINGLYRHGFLLAPVYVERVVSLVRDLKEIAHTL